MIDDPVTTKAIEDIFKTSAEQIYSSAGGSGLLLVNPLAATGKKENDNQRWSQLTSCFTYAQRQDFEPTSPQTITQKYGKRLTW